MWPFSSRGNRQKTTSPHPVDLPPFEQFEVDNAVLKLWLPEILSDRVNWLGIKLQVSRPDALRALLFEQVYGRVAYEGLRAYGEEKLAKASRRPRSDPFKGEASHTAIPKESPWEITRSVSRDTYIDLEYLGKSTDDFKLHLPALLKSDLTLIARQYGLTPSSYARKLLVQKLLGERLHTDWQKALGKISPDVESLERD